MLQTATTLQLRRTHIADEERLELSTIGLTSRRSAIELFIHVDPKRFELLPFGLEDQYTSVMLRINSNKSIAGPVRFELTTPRLKAGYI